MAAVADRNIALVGCDPVLDSAVHDVLLDCFEAIQAAARYGIELLEGEGYDLLSTAPSCGPVSDIIATLSEAWCFCARLAAVMDRFACGSEPVSMSAENAEYIVFVEAIIADLVDAGGPCASCRKSGSSDG